MFYRTKKKIKKVKQVTRTIYKETKEKSPTEKPLFLNINCTFQPSFEWKFSNRVVLNLGKKKNPILSENRVKPLGVLSVLLPVCYLQNKSLNQFRSR